MSSFTQLTSGVINLFYYIKPKQCSRSFFLFPHVPPSYSQENNCGCIERIELGDGLESRKVPYLKLENKEAKVNLIYFHGNGEDLGLIKSMLMEFRDNMCANVYSIEYPNYGIYDYQFQNTQKKASRIKQDSKLFYRKLRQQEPSFKKLKTVVIGRSIGSGPACYLSSQENQIHYLILISPFYSIKSLLASKLRFAQKLVNDYFNNFETARNFKGNMLIIHGKKDQVVNFSQGKKLYGEISKVRTIKKTNVKIQERQNMTHNDFNLQYDIFGPIKSFIKEELSGHNFYQQSTK